MPFTLPLWGFFSHARPAFFSPNFFSPTLNSQNIKETEGRERSESSSSYSSASSSSASSSSASSSSASAEAQEQEQEEPENPDQPLQIDTILTTNPITQTNQPLLQISRERYSTLIGIEQNIEKILAEGLQEYIEASKG